MRVYKPSNLFHYHLLECKSPAVSHNHTITFLKIILCCYSCPADVVLHFDLDCCGVLYDGKGVCVTERARRAIT